jgi:hypothetical protein
MNPFALAADEPHPGAARRSQPLPADNPSSIPGIQHILQIEGKHPLAAARICRDPRNRSPHATALGPVGRSMTHEGRPLVSPQHDSCSLSPGSSSCSRCPPGSPSPAGLAPGGPESPGRAPMRPLTFASSSPMPLVAMPLHLRAGPRRRDVGLSQTDATVPVRVAASELAQPFHNRLRHGKVDKGCRAPVPSRTPFMCPVCGKMLCRQAYLEAHMTTHTLARPFRCDGAGCDMSFRFKSNLNRYGSLPFVPDLDPPSESLFP